MYIGLLIIKVNNIKKIIWHMLDQFNIFEFFRFYLFLKKSNYEYIITNNLTGFSVAIWYAAFLRKIKIIHILRDYYLISSNSTLLGENKNKLLRYFDKLLSKIKRKLSKKVKIVIGISEFILNKHLEEGYFKNANKVIIYNQIEENIIIKEKLNNNIKMYGYLGRIEKSKGIEVLLRAFNEIKINERIKIGGTGNKEYIKYLESNFELSNVDFLGQIEKQDFFNQIDCLLVPSIWDEPFGRVVIEAIQNNIPVLVSGTGGLLELSKIFNSVRVTDFNNIYQFRKDLDLAFFHKSDIEILNKYFSKQAYQSKIYDILNC